MSFVSSTVFRFPPYPEKKLTMDEMLAKLINEGKREHEKMEIFIKEFRTTNELLLKEQNNLLSELKIKVNELSRVMNEVWFSKHQVKGVTTRGGKVISKVTYDNEMYKDMPEDSRIPIILGRPFLATARAMIDVFNKKITLQVGDDEVVFDMEQSMKKPSTEDDECY
ncbi:hypothetical protein Tco_0953765 [Tanacetum coccineum]|uniref:Reverse transcriptase domain-containing protein n=1 Tax=Tanacetum coccineum TaxID=301880 RepID=A0ABQ5E0T3_9ASTR